MKNAIQYYYGLYPSDIHLSNGSYQFDIKEEHYFLTPCKRNLEELPELFKISRQLFERGVLCHQFVFNMKQEIVTWINQIPYILFQVYLYSFQKITIEDVLFFSNLTIIDTEKSLLKRNHWKQMWMEKNDYFEYQVNQFGKQFPKIRESFSYFIGLSEIGIALLNEVNQDNLVLAHQRLSYTDTIFDLYNPMNFIFDYKERDWMEYWKSKIWSEDYDIKEFEAFIKILPIKESEYFLLLARAFYPTFYFDQYEKIMNHQENEMVLNLFLNNIEKYEDFLSFLYLYIQSKILLPDMPWLTKRIKLQ